MVHAEQQGAASRVEVVVHASGRSAAVVADEGRRREEQREQEHGALALHSGSAFLPCELSHRVAWSPVSVKG